jgi:hypothetical protein
MGAVAEEAAILALPDYVVNPTYPHFLFTDAALSSVSIVIPKVYTTTSAVYGTRKLAKSVAFTYFCG